MKNWIAVLAFACVGAHVEAGEVEDRARIRAEVQADFAAGRYQELEDRWTAALAQSARMPSGVFVNAVIHEAIIRGLSGESQVPGRDDYWNPVERKLDDWAAKFPQSSFVAIARSGAFIGHGWSWRGSGYARTVSPEGSKKLDLYLKRAEEALMSRQNAGRKDPYWYVQKRRYPSAYSIDLHASLACAAADKSVTAALLAQIGAHPRMNVWNLMGGKGLLERCREWTAAPEPEIRRS